MLMLVMYRKMKYGEEESEVDQTESVAEEMEAKTVPELKTEPSMQIPSPVPAPAPQPVVAPLALPDPRGIAPLPPTGLPEGWTQEQWNHFGWKYIEGFSKR